MNKLVPKAKFKDYDELFDPPAAKHEAGTDNPTGGEKRRETVYEIPVEDIRPYSGHPFALYEGERLDDLVESIRNNGVMVPTVTRRIKNEKSKVEMLAGHNRLNAAKIAGLKTVPGTILENVADDDALGIVITTNLMQRSFLDMKHSEKARVINMRYEKLFSQGKRTEIIEALNSLDGFATTEEMKAARERFKTNEKIGEQYGMSRNTVARYLRIHKLADELKKPLDSGRVQFLVAVEASFLKEPEQGMLAQCLSEGFKINIFKAKKLRRLSAKKELDPESMREVLRGTGEGTGGGGGYRVNLDRKTFSKYFGKDESPEKVKSTIEKALEAYFAENGEPQSET